MRLKRKKKLESPGAVKSGTSNKYYKMSNTDCMSVIELPRVGCLLPTLIIEMVERECVGCGERKSNGIEEDDEWICEDCDGPECDCCGDKTLNQGCGKMVNRGCCSNGACDQGVDVLCGECGTWDEEDEVWRCPDCQEEHENNCTKTCETCKKPCWSDDDEVQFSIHGCAVCKECFDEHEEAHKPDYRGRVVPRFNFQFSDGDERGQDIDGQWWVRVKSDKWDWDYEESDEEMKARGAMDGDGFVVCGTCGKGGGAHATEDCAI